MKRSLLIIIILITAITGCERDDICIDPTTPNFTIRFYDFEDQSEFKNVQNIQVEIIGIEGMYTDNNQTITGSTDSIALPVKVNEMMTQYILTSNSTDNTLISVDTVTINYDVQEVFVGRSCGFKANFNNVNYQTTSNWIQSIEVVTDTIANENAAQLNIFF